jgi:hypothetical protein
VFFGIRYTKSLQDILNTEGGKVARDMVHLSTPALAGKIEAFTQRQRKWSDTELSPQAAAITSIAVFGMELARHGQTPAERLAGSSLKLALIDYSKATPSAQAACVAVLTKWQEVRPERQSAPHSVVDGGVAWTTAAKAAAAFMTIQAGFLKALPEPPEFDGPTAAAFAYGVWDAATQPMGLSDDESLDSLCGFVTQWLAGAEPKTVAETVEAIVEHGTQDRFTDTVVTGGQAFRVWQQGPPGDWFPVQLGQCLIQTARSRARQRG